MFDLILDASLGQDVFKYNYNRLYDSWCVREQGSQKKLADKIGVTQSRISYWTHGMAMPSFLNLYNLSSVFGVSMDEFYKEIPNE